MAGRGPRPKDPSTRARRNKPPVSERVIEVDAADQPSLPESMPLGAPWPAETTRWWRMWSESPLAEEFTASDWSELMDTAVLHGAFWSGQISVANELRLRVAKFGATPEDRARLRITFAQADEAEEKRPVTRSARERRGSLKAL
jgi:hypothetical protein